MKAYPASNFAERAHFLEKSDISQEQSIFQGNMLD